MFPICVKKKGAKNRNRPMKRGKKSKVRRARDRRKIIENSQLRLVPGAVPSIFPNYPEYLLAKPSTSKDDPESFAEPKEEGNENEPCAAKSTRKRGSTESSSSTERSNKKLAISSSTPPVSTIPPTLLSVPEMVPAATTESTSVEEYVIKYRRLVNLDYFIKSLQKLNDHGGERCNFSDMMICGETKEGWNAGVMLKCRICSRSEVVWLENPVQNAVPVLPSSTQTQANQMPASFGEPPAFTQVAPMKQKRPHRTKKNSPPLDLDTPIGHYRSQISKHTFTQSRPSTDPPLIGQPQIQTFIKQEVILPEDTSSMSHVPATQPTAVQLLFCVDQPESSKESTDISSASETITPDVFVGSQGSLVTSSAGLVSEDITITPDIHPADVLPVDLNLVKKEKVDDGEPTGGASGSLYQNNEPSFYLVPMSETSLSNSANETVSASDQMKSTPSTELPKASSVARIIYAKDAIKTFKTMPILTKISSDEQTETSATVSVTASPNAQTTTSRSPYPKYSKLVVKKNAKSLVWNYFGWAADKCGRIIDHQRSVCRICKERVSNRMGSTTHMIYHLRVHHPSTYKQMVRASKPRAPQLPRGNDKVAGAPSCSASMGNAESETGSLEDVESQGDEEKEVIFSSMGVNYSKLVQKKRNHSLIWNYFGMPADESGRVINRYYAVCWICRSFVASKCGSTTKMINHLRVQHPLKYKNILKGSKRFLSSPHSPSMTDYEDDAKDSTEDIQCEKTPLRDTESPIHKKRKTSLHQHHALDPHFWEFYTKSVTKFLAFTMQSYCVVEMKPFIDLLKLLNPPYKLPCLKYFTKIGIPKLYNATVEKMKEELATVKVKVISLTIDCWASVDNTPYIAVTAHFIDNDWILKSACLSCTHFGINGNNILTSILSDWGLDVASVTCCTDNNSKVLNTMSPLQLPHISCFAHIINEGMNRALRIDRLENAVAMLKMLQSSISQNSMMKRGLAEAQESLQMKVESLPSVCPTMWRSTLKLVRRFLSNQVPISKMLQDYPDQKHLMPEDSVISALKDFVSNTKLLEDITTTLSGGEYVAASTVLPLYREIKKNLQCQDSDSALSKKIKCEILKAISECYEEESLKTILWMSSLCDPRFRLRFTDNADDIQALALQEMARILSSSISQSATSGKQVKKGLAKLLEVEDNAMDDSMPENKAKAELNKYLAMPKVSLDTNPLTWWKSHEVFLPTLKTLAKKYLAIQGSSVPVESVFSTRGIVVMRKRAALLPKHAEMQIFLANNKHSI